MARSRAEVISEMVDSGLFSDDEIRAASQKVEPTETASPKNPDLLSTLYHGAIEGGAMTVGGLAAGTVGSLAGPLVGAGSAVAGAAAMYPPAKRAAESIDRYRGITPPEQPNIAKEYGEGLAIEAGGAALGAVAKPVMKGIGKILPGAKTGEMLSGTPARNLERAYKQGFTETYLKPKRLAEAGENFGAEKFKMVADTLTPEEQVGMMVNPRGEANSKVADVMTRWLKGQDIGPDEALAARQGIDTIFPADTAAKQVQRGGLSQFRDAMNKIIGEKNPAFKQASDDYAKSKLRSQLLKPFRVNKSNPDQYSKLSGMLAGLLGAGGASTGTILPAVGYALGTSPLAMGITSSVAGSVGRGVESAVMNPTVRRAVLSELISRVNDKNGR